MAFGLENLFFLPSAISIDLFGSRKVAIFGACLQTIGLLSSGFVNDLPVYFFTHSVLFGIGKGFVAQSTYQILPHYFNKKLGLATGLMNFGGSIFAILIVIISDASLATFGLKSAFFIFMTLSSLTVIAASSFKSVLKSQSYKIEKFSDKIKNSLSTDVLKRKEFMIWWTSTYFSVFGFIIISVTIVCI
jgi:MFS family permease